MEIPEYSIVIPVYNSGAWLPELVERIVQTMAPLAKPFEIILVNDASPDENTWPAIEQLAAEHTAVCGIDMLYNVGQFRAILCGFELARGPYVITMDDDFQHPPEELPKLVAAMQDHPRLDCIMGAYEGKQHGPIRNLGSRLLQSIMNWLYDKPSGIRTTSFRIMKKEFADTLALYRIAHPQLGPLIVHMTDKMMNIPVAHHPRPYGRSGYRFVRLAGETMRSIVNASVAPLRFVTCIGLCSASLAFLLGLHYLGRWLLGGIGVPGYTSLILTIVFFSGMILMSVGILGEYIGRIIQEVTGMPRYTIRRRTGEVQQ